MGWKGYESTISLGMLFKKMYCHKCGNKLKRKRETYVIRKGEKGYSNQIAGITTIGMDRIQQSYYVYVCPNCNSKITYEEQCVIAKEQKKRGEKIINLTHEPDS